MSNSSIYKSPAGENAVIAMYDSMLARWPVPFETMNIPTRHGNTFVIASGNPTAVPLVLLHGAGSNSLTWSDDVAVYSKLYRVYAIDLLGEAGKSSTNRPEWDSPAYAEWLQDVFEALMIEKATIIGLSQGAWTALKFAVIQPKSVEKLVLLTPGGIVPDKPSFVFRALLYSLFGRWGSQRINRMLLAGHSVSNEVEEALILIMTHFKPRVSPLPIFTDQELESLRLPVLLLIGGKDALRDADKITFRMQKQVPNLTARIIPEGGHALLGTPKFVLPFLQ